MNARGLTTEAEQNLTERSTVRKISEEGTIMAVTAVTGDIGSGKSTVSAMLAKLLECEAVDADKIAAEIWTHNDVKSSAVSRWGSGILDAHGNVIKSEIAKHVFADPEENRFVNSLIHPSVMNQLHQLAVSHNGSNIVIEIPLLPETGRPFWVDRAVYVTAKFESRAERCRRSRGWSFDELRRRENLLLPQSQRISICDFIIRNESSLSDLEGQAVKFLQENFC